MSVPAGLYSSETFRGSKCASTAQVLQAEERVYIYPRSPPLSPPSAGHAASGPSVLEVALYSRSPSWSAGNAAGGPRTSNPVPDVESLLKPKNFSVAPGQMHQQPQAGTAAGTDQREVEQDIYQDIYMMEC
jgi:hypothetical protein